MIDRRFTIRKRQGQIRSRHYDYTQILPFRSQFLRSFHPRYVAATCVESDSTSGNHWSSYSPYRFSVEFWDVGLLKEKLRLHSHTIWYACNLFNVYVQIMRKKGEGQLGIYRQSNVDPLLQVYPPTFTDARY